MGHLSKGYKDHPNQLKNSHKLCKEMGHPFFEFEGKSVETEITTSAKFPNGGKAIVELILVVSGGRNPKEQDCQRHNQRSE